MKRRITSVFALAFMVSAGVLASPSAASAISCYDLAAYEAEPINAVLGISAAPATLSTLFVGACSNHGYLVDVTYRFDFDGDGTWDEENLVGIASHRFMEDGTYNPRLEVTDGYGRTASTTEELVIGPVTDLGPPRSPDDGSQPLEGIQFTPTSLHSGESGDLSASVEDGVTTVAAMTPASDDPWNSATLTAKLGPFTGPGPWEVLIPEGTAAGEYDIMLVTDNGYAGSVRIEVVSDFPWLLISGAGALVVAAGTVLIISRRRRRRRRKVRE